MNKEEINKEFLALLECMSEDQFWEWIRTWYDSQVVCDCISDWDADIKFQEIKKMKEIMKLK